jgi:hypothetical protein
VFYNQGRRPNAAFRRVMAALTGDARCNARRGAGRRGVRRDTRGLERGRATSGVCGAKARHARPVGGVSPHPALTPTAHPPVRRGPVRLHWGKAGWPDPGCFRGDEAYGDNWCSFG